MASSASPYSGSQVPDLDLLESLEEMLSGCEATAGGGVGQTVLDLPGQPKIADYLDFSVDQGSDFENLGAN